MRGSTIFVGFAVFLLMASFVVEYFVLSLPYQIDINDHLKRAADANTVELAKQEMRTAVGNIEKRGWTQGYTSLIIQTPDEDVGFWYQNLKASQMELESVNPDASQLEKSNVLMKLRETTLDDVTLIDDNVEQENYDAQVRED